MVRVYDDTGGHLEISQAWVSKEANFCIFCFSLLVSNSYHYAVKSHNSQWKLLSVNDVLSYFKLQPMARS